MTDFPTLKMKALVNFPAQAFGRVGINVAKTAGAFYIDIDYSRIQKVGSGFDPALTNVLGYNVNTNVYSLISVNALAGSTGTAQVVTAAGPVTVQSGDGIIALNKTVGAATAVQLPLAFLKTGPVLITDLKGDAGTNNITISPTAPETIQGLPTLTIAGNGGSVFLRPIPGIGYVL